VILNAILELDEKAEKLIKIHEVRKMRPGEFETWKIVNELIKAMEKIDLKRKVR